MAEEVDQVERYAALADAVDSGDADLARARAVDLLGPATRSLVSAIDQLEAVE